MIPIQNFQEVYDKSVAEAQATCSWPWVFNYETPLPGGNFKVHQIFMIITGAAGILNVVIALFLSCGHFLNWTKPQEQKQYLRIIFLPVVISIVCFLGVTYYDATDQILPVGQLYEGFAIAALFLLYVQIIAPNEQTAQSLAEIERNSGTNLRKAYKLILQLIPVRVICFIAFEALFGATCPLAQGRKTGRTVITVFQAISTVVAVLRIIKFERTNKAQLVGHRPMMKLAAIKVVVALDILQGVVFSALGEHGFFLPPSPYRISHNDLLRGLPQVLFAVEMAVASVVFIWAFGFGRFRVGSKAAGPVGALVSTMNPWDELQGTFYAFFGSRRAGEVDAAKYKSYVGEENGA